jgi:hypothetical protein
VIVLKVIAGPVAAAMLEKVKLTATRFPGQHSLTLVIRTPEQVLRGEDGRRLTLGGEWLYDGSAACLAALSEFGKAEVQC